MVFPGVKRTDINNEIASPIAIGLVHGAVQFARPGFHARFSRRATVLFPKETQIVAGFLRNTKHEVEECERSDVRTRSPSSIAIDGGEPQIRRIVENRDGARRSSF